MHVSTHSHFARFHPLPLEEVKVSDGFWGHRQQINREISLAHGYQKLIEYGNLNNLRLAAGGGQGEYQGYLFQDSDVYKWLEAAVISLGQQADPGLEAQVDEAIACLAAAQQPDGYLNSCYTVLHPGKRWTDLEHGHELYCAGHLIEAAIAQRRATGKNDLLVIAQRYADYIDSVFGPGKREATCGHSEIELALVELYRETGESRYRDLAAFFIGQRGKGIMDGYQKWGPAYHQDRVPVRQANQVEGHAVRQLYLNAGVTDLYLETGEDQLLQALQMQWLDMTSRKMYLTGGVGAHAESESFGEAFDLPNEAAYCETCAAIASIMWNWRMLLATGESRFADLIERTLYNGFLSGVALDGKHFYYVNPLQSKGNHQRQEWHRCACCPPNVMRLLASVGNYAVTSNALGLQIHQYMDLDLETELENRGKLALRMRTDYPWQGQVTIAVSRAPVGECTLALRMPGWCPWTRISVNDEVIQNQRVCGRYVSITRVWQPGDRIEMEMRLVPRLMSPHPRIESLHGCVAVERGPLVYCFEAVDQTPDITLDAVSLISHAPLQASWRNELEGIVVIEARGSKSNLTDWQDQLYRPLMGSGVPRKDAWLYAVPYFAWGNRAPGDMRVWVPMM